jgi:hypothetical protein
MRGLDAWIEGEPPDAHADCKGACYACGACLTCEGCVCDDGAGSARRPDEDEEASA